MAYNPNLHVPTNKPVGIGQAIPTDGRSYYYDEALFKYRPYQSEAEVLAYLNTAASRTGQFSIFINDGTLESDGTFTGGTITEYWFKDGTDDADLIVKESGGGGGSAPTDSTDGIFS